MEKYTKEEALELVRQAYDMGVPIFILQPKDKLAPYLVRKYSEMLKDTAIGEFKSSGDEAIFESQSYKLAQMAEKLATAMLEWQGLNFMKVKLPD